MDSRYQLLSINQVRWRLLKASVPRLLEKAHHSDHYTHTSRMNMLTHTLSFAFPLCRLRLVFFFLSLLRDCEALRFASGDAEGFFAFEFFAFGVVPRGVEACGRELLIRLASLSAASIGRERSTTVRQRRSPGVPILGGHGKKARNTY